MNIIHSLKACIRFGLLGFILLLFACSASKDSSDGLPPNTPAIPQPTYPGESLPATSDILVYVVEDISDFEPELDNVPASVQSALGGSYCYYPYPQRRLMVDGGAKVDPVGLAVRLCCAPSCAWSVQYPNGPALDQVPKIQWVRYWKRLVNVTVPESTTYQQSHTYTEGTSETNGESFAMSLGLSASGWGLGLSAELTYTFSREVTVSSESSVTKTFTCNSESGKIIQFTVWQLVDGFRICDSDGNTFTDPEYDFYSMPQVDNETDQLYMSIVKFDL